MLVAIAIFILGLIFGSFLNVLICRLPDIRSIITTRSHCPKCKRQLAWSDLVPVASFVALGRQCRYCGKSISWQYPVVEIIPGLILVAIYLYFGLTVYGIYLMLISLALIVIFVYDQKNQIIPDEMLIYSLIVIAIYYLLSYQNYSFGLVLLGGLVGAGVIGLIVLVTRGKGMGIGDIKLAGVLGLILGFPNIIVTLFLSFIIGAIYGLILILTGQKSLKAAIAFGPFLIIGFYIAIFWGEQILNWYTGI